MAEPLWTYGLFARHEAGLRALARSLLADVHAAEDVTQQAWMELLERPPRLPVRLGGWLRRVVERRARNLQRAESRRCRHEERSAVPERVPSVEETLERRETRRRIVRALSRMPERYRTVLMLRYYADQSPAEIASQLGVSRETVKSRLRRGRQWLRAELERECGGRESLLAGLLLLGSPGERAVPAAWCMGGGALAAAAVVLLAVVTAGNGDSLASAPASRTVAASTVSLAGIPGVVREPLAHTRKVTVARGLRRAAGAVGASAWDH